MCYFWQWHKSLHNINILPNAVEFDKGNLKKNHAYILRAQGM